MHSRQNFYKLKNNIEFRGKEVLVGLKIKTARRDVIIRSRSIKFIQNLVRGQQLC